MTERFVSAARLLDRGQREDRAAEGIRMGYTVAQMARYLEVSQSTIRRDLRHAAERGNTIRETGPDAFRWKP
jgi:Fic family protein